MRLRIEDKRGGVWSWSCGWSWTKGSRTLTPRKLGHVEFRRVIIPLPAKSKQELAAEAAQSFGAVSDDTWRTSNEAKAVHTMYGHVTVAKTNGVHAVVTCLDGAIKHVHVKNLKLASATRARSAAIKKAIPDKEARKRAKLLEQIEAIRHLL